MKLFSFVMVLALVSLGCGPQSETLPTVTGGSGDSATSGVTDDNAQMDSSSEAPPSGDGAAVQQDQPVRFVADRRLEIPSMMCPYGCYPAVQETLAKLEGVQAVQLAEQPEGTPEGEIRTKIVELKVGDDFDLDKTLAVLKSANFEAKQVN